MRTTIRATDPPSLQALRKRLQRWRQLHGGPGRRIPAWVWSEAAAIAATSGLPTTAQALGLASGRLESRMRDVGDATAGPSQFVEIASALVDAGKQIVVEIEVPDGTRVRVSGASAQTVAHVASTLLHTRSERS